AHPDQPGDWRVEGGILKGRGDHSHLRSHLFSDRADFENFHLKARVRINEGGNSGLLFRTEFGLHGFNSWYPSGYEAEINGGDTGSLLGHTAGNSRIFQYARWQTMPQNALKDLTNWYTMEVIAEGAHIVIRIDERTEVDYTLPAGYRKRGHLALQYVGPQTVVEFSKIEVKELPRSER